MAALQMLDGLVLLWVVPHLPRVVSFWDAVALPRTLSLAFGMLSVCFLLCCLSLPSLARFRAPSIWGRFTSKVNHLGGHCG